MKRWGTKPRPMSPVPKLKQESMDDSDIYIKEMPPPVAPPPPFAPSRADPTEADTNAFNNVMESNSFPYNSNMPPLQNDSTVDDESIYLDESAPLHANSKSKKSKATKANVADQEEPTGNTGLSVPLAASSISTTELEKPYATVRTSSSNVAVAPFNGYGKKKVPPTVISTEDDQLERPYDLTPLDIAGSGLTSGAIRGSYSIDPWARNESDGSVEEEEALNEPMDEPETHPKESRSTFIGPGDIHPNMEHKEDEIARLRLLAGKLSADWKAPDFMAPALARRIRDFQFAQEKRRKKYGDERPWGILGLYDYLSSIRIDVEWAEDAAQRRANGEPYLSWVDFDESKKGRSNRPYFTYVLLFTCTVLLAASFAVNDWKLQDLAENPMIGPSAETLIKMGAKDTELIVHKNEGWRLLSSTVLHAGLVHYMINMLALWFVGAAIEMSHGWVAAMIIFTLSAVGGTILSSLFLPEYITVGASGGIFGFIGACLADIIMNWKLLFSNIISSEDGKQHRHAIIVVVLLLDIVLNSIIGLTPFVDNFTHLGGMVYGFLCGLSTIERLSIDFFGMEEDYLTQVKHFFMRFFGLIMTIFSIVVTIIVLLEGDGSTTPCKTCTWLSCVPFPPWAHDDEKWWYCDECERVSAEIISKPVLHLELNCPSGSIATIDLSNEPDVGRETLKKNLPSYCRHFCTGGSSSSLDSPEFDELLN